MKRKFIFLNSSDFQPLEMGMLLILVFVFWVGGNFFALSTKLFETFILKILVSLGFALIPAILTLLLLLLDVYIITGHKSVYLGGYLYIFSKKIP